MLIGLTGRIASGKGVVLDYLTSNGFMHFSLSDEVREEARKRNLPLERAHLQNIGNELRKTFGNSVLAKRALQRIVSDKKKDCIIDGIRNPSEVEELRKRKDFFLIAIDAPQKLRFQRILERKREKNEEMKSWNEFLKDDERDFGVNEENSGQ